MNNEKEGLIVVKNKSENSIPFYQESKCDTKLMTFFWVGFLTLAYVIVEIGAALWLRSLVLLSDGFHNFSDVLSIGIAFWARKASKRESSSWMTYGWARAEIIGGFINTCFLLSLCFYIALESITKFFEPVSLKETGVIFIAVAGGGLVVNTIGTIAFAVTGQKHPHSHRHSHQDGKKKKKASKSQEMAGFNRDNTQTTPKPKSTKDFNVYAVFLHYLGDLLSSLTVLIAGVVIEFFNDDDWIDYIDPVSSLLIIALILVTTVPLLTQTCSILIQRTPSIIDVDEVRLKIMKVEGIINVHDFHVWELVDGIPVCSVHIACEEGIDFNNVRFEVKRIFHSYGIHSSSIQPEFAPRNLQMGKYCEQNCLKGCEEEWCCRKSAMHAQAALEEYSISTEL